MNLLLDTHAWLWWLTNDPRLSECARDAIADVANDVHVSAVSALEIATKVRLGKLAEAAEVLDRYDELILKDQFQHLPIAHYHALRAGACPAAHRDPFDRLLAAQSELESLTLVTRDPAFAEFGTTVLW